MGCSVVDMQTLPTRVAVSMYLSGTSPRALVKASWQRRGPQAICRHLEATNTGKPMFDTRSTGGSRE